MVRCEHYQKSSIHVYCQLTGLPCHMCMYFKNYRNVSLQEKMQVWIQFGETRHQLTIFTHKGDWLCFDFIDSVVGYNCLKCFRLPVQFTWSIVFLTWELPQNDKCMNTWSQNFVPSSRLVTVWNQSSTLSVTGSHSGKRALRGRSKNFRTHFRNLTVSIFCTTDLGMGFGYLDALL